METFAGYVNYMFPDYCWSNFSASICAELDQFLIDVLERKRPVLILQGPPQHGKSELVSRLFPAYISSKFPETRIVGTSYGQNVADSMATDMKQYVRSDSNLKLFPEDKTITRKGFKIVDRVNYFTNYNSRMGKGYYYGVGMGGALTSKRWDIGIIDDPTKNAEEALNPNRADKAVTWYRSTFITRRSKYSGQLIMATCWGENDPVNKIIELNKTNPNFKHLAFPAINEEGEEGYNSKLPLGALVPDLHPMDELLETKALVSGYWWACMYQQSPVPLNGAIFKKDFIQYYRSHELPKSFPNCTHSWDIGFKKTKDSDFVVGQVWCKMGTRNYLMTQVRARMSFTETCAELKKLWKAFPKGKVLVEEKANGAAVIDVLKKYVPTLKAINPKESKEARAHAVTGVWESMNVWLPHPDDAPWIEGFVKRLLIFDGKEGGIDDEVDAMTQALSELNPYFSGFNVTKNSIDKLKQIYLQKQMQR